MPRCENELLSMITAAEREALTPHLRMVLLPSGTVLHESGGSIQHVYFPFDGAISLIAELKSGARVETALVGWDGAVGAFGALHNVSAINTAVVQLECTAGVIPADQIRRFCGQGSALASVLELHNQFLACHAHQVAACNAAHNLEARLIRWLLRANDLCGPRLKVTQESLAALLAVRRTSVSLTAHSLQTRGLIRYQRGVIEIHDLERLRAVSCECYKALCERRVRLLEAA